MKAPASSTTPTNQCRSLSAAPALPPKATKHSAPCLKKGHACALCRLRRWVMLVILEGYQFEMHASSHLGKHSGAPEIS